MDPTLTMRIVGSVILTVGLVIHYVIARRKFNRRAITGVETFSSFEKAKITRLVEGLGKLISRLLILGGLVLIVVSLFQ